jgi:Tol biopolymer transport system component
MPLTGQPGKRFHRTSIYVLLIILLGLPASIGSAAPGDPEIVSVATDGTSGNADSFGPAISANGQIIAFQSHASNLIPNDTNGVQDIFVHNRLTGITRRVSISHKGGNPNGPSSAAAISADGRFVAFESAATNLVAGGTRTSGGDIFVHDRRTRTTTLVSVASDGTQSNRYSQKPELSADGRFVAFISRATNLVSDDTNGADDIFVHDRETGTTTRASVASDDSQSNHWSYSLSISGDGRLVAFQSMASNLVPNDTNDEHDIFVHDREIGATSLVSAAPDGAPANYASRYPQLSADGRFVAFQSAATNLIPEDTNGRRKDVFVHDRETGTTSLASISTDGAQHAFNSGGATMSSDGRYVGLVSSRNCSAVGIYHHTCVLVHDRWTGVTINMNSLFSDPYAYSTTPSIDARGRRIAFSVERHDAMYVASTDVSYRCWGKRATILGTPGDDALIGTDGPDVIMGLGGNDSIDGLGGNDVICGDGKVDNVVIGSERAVGRFNFSGHDTLNGGEGDDRIVGGLGDDELNGDAGNDALHGGRGTDTCVHGVTVVGCE